MTAYLNFSATVASCPVREKFAGKLLMNAPNPCAGDGDVVWIFVEQLFQATYDIDRQILRHCEVSQRADSRIQFARGVWRAG